MEVEKKKEIPILEENNKETNQESTIKKKPDNLIKSIMQNKKNKNITIFKSIKENYLSWIAIFIAIYLISHKQFLKSVVTFFVIFFLAYFVHVRSHYQINFFTVLHHYHHNHSNFFSHFIQIIMELGFPSIFLFLQYLYGTIFLDSWIIMLSVLFYTSVHNINYGYFRVNNIHSLHHKKYFTNYGPDFCDIIFGTKNNLNKKVENTNHYIPNIFIITIIILFLQYCCLNETFKNIFNKLIVIFLLSCFAIYIISSFYIYYFLIKT